MSEFQPNELLPVSVPKCPLCGGEMFLAPMHKAVAKAVNVFRCRECGVDYPVERKAL
jgi:tRNA(Ile2) C34 agmatinyltransferase TiaS